MSEFVTKDSGAREDFEGGSRRDTQEGKPRFDLIPPTALVRLADLYARGADKYGEHNWTLGQPVSRFIASGLRHFMQALMGDKTEDHWAAVLFNVLAIIHFEDTDWNDQFDWTPQNRPQAPKAPTFDTVTALAKQQLQTSKTVGDLHSYNAAADNRAADARRNLIP